MLSGYSKYSEQLTSEGINSESLSRIQNKQFKREVTELENDMDTGSRKGEHLLTYVSEKLISENLFNNLVDDVHARCRLINQI